MAPIDGSHPRELLRCETGLEWIDWSPDGRRIRYVSPRPEEDHAWPWIREIAVSGGSPRPLWRGHMGGWTEDGRYYVFDLPPTHDLFVAEETPWTRWWPGTPRQLTSGRGGFTFRGSSRDGGRLVVNQGGPTTRGTLLRYDPEKELFEPVLGGESAFYAEPSPDGEWLAWVRYPEGTLWRSRPDGTERLQLTRPPAVAHLPRWSPDGTQLVFISQPETPALMEVRVVAADGSASRLIARPEPPDGDYWDACWLPDDSIILSRMSQPGLLRYEPSAQRLAPVPGAEGLMYPECARQGHVWASPGHLRRWGETEWQAVDATVGGFPNWTRDGRSVCGLPPGWRIRCLDVGDGLMSELADASAVALTSWTGWPWMGLDAEDRPLVVASPGTASVHVLILEQP